MVLHAAVFSDYEMKSDHACWFQPRTLKFHLFLKVIDIIRLSVIANFNDNAGQRDEL